MSIISNRINYDLSSQFQRHQITRTYDKKEYTYKTQCRPLWDWIMDHLVDPELIKQFEWDAQKVSRFCDGKYTQMYTEPWTGKRFWDVQVKANY